MKKNLTFRFCSQDILYESAQCGIYSFAAAFLLQKGFQDAQVGIILCSANLLSAFLSPIIGSWLDHIGGSRLPLITRCLCGICLVCTSIKLFFSPPQLIYAFLHILSVCSLDMILPFQNSLSVYYTGKGYTLNYGLGRGLGAFSYALASLAMGAILKNLGTNWLLIAVISLEIGYVINGAFYPREQDTEKISNSAVPGEEISLFSFFQKYKRYCVSLLGVFFLAAFHSSVENYMIEIIEPLGGDSGNFGTALFLATATGFPVMIFFEKIHNKLGSYKIFLIAGIAYIVKGIIFLSAKNLAGIYAAELLQCITFNFLSPNEMYYARECIPERDMIKGQSFIMAAYTLGCALGNLLGGVITGTSGVRVMMGTALCSAVLGTCILALFSGRTGSTIEKVNHFSE